jgi:hypothetical protein
VPPVSHAEIVSIRADHLIFALYIIPCYGYLKSQFLIVKQHGVKKVKVIFLT